MDCIVDAAMARVSAAKELAVRSIHDGIDSQTGDVSVPQNLVFSIIVGKGSEGNDSLLAQYNPQISILYAEIIPL